MGIFKLFPARESSESDIPAGDGKTANLFVTEYRPLVADWYHFDEEQDSDPDPHQSEKSDPNSHQSEKRDSVFGPDPHEGDVDGSRTLT